MARPRPQELRARPRTLHRLAGSSKASWFSYYQTSRDSDPEAELEEEECSVYCDLASPRTLDTQLTLSPVEDRVVSPCAELDQDPAPGIIIMSRLRSPEPHYQTLNVMLIARCVSCAENERRRQVATLQLVDS